MDLIESNFTRWANYWVGIAALMALVAAALTAFLFIFR
jgi:hypothetical protein